MLSDALTRTLSMLKPADLYPAWKWIDLMERAGEMGGVEAQRWKRGIFGLMELWGTCERSPRPFRTRLGV